MELVITAIGANSLATSSMLKAGADHAATGENAVVVGWRSADIIVGVEDLNTGKLIEAVITEIQNCLDCAD